MRDLDVTERFVTMKEINEAAIEGRLLEVFGAGTAAVVCPVSAIRYQGKDIEIPATGPVTKRCWDLLTGIQYGSREGPPGWSVSLT
jgi:branched-chain amino acid aminotransferase